MEAAWNAVVMEGFGLMLSGGQESADSVALVFPRQTSSNKSVTDAVLINVARWNTIKPFLQVLLRT